MTTYALHPGVVATGAFRHLDESMCRGMGRLIEMMKFAVMTPKQGAQTSIYCAVDEKIAAQSGLYYRSVLPLRT